MQGNGSIELVSAAARSPLSRAGGSKEHQERATPSPSARGAGKVGIMEPSGDLDYAQEIRDTRRTVRWQPGMNGSTSSLPPAPEQTAMPSKSSKGGANGTPMALSRTPADKLQNGAGRRRDAIKIDPAVTGRSLEISEFMEDDETEGPDLNSPSSNSAPELGKALHSTAEVPGWPTVAPVHIPSAPGGVSAPVKAWVRSRSITFGFYQLPPFSTRFRIFSKRSGVMFGTEVDVDAARLIMPQPFVAAPPSFSGSKDEQQRRQEAQYLEYTLEGLRPNSKYTIKITGVGQKQTAKGYLTTISDAEQYKRDTVMSQFAGVVVMVGGRRDCTVSKFNAVTGLFTLLPVEAEEVAPPLQLRFRSDYSSEGHPAQAFTLSTIFFSRWGGEMRSSATLSAGEMQERAVRAADSRATTRAEREYNLRAQLLNREMRDLKLKMAEDRKAAAEERALVTRVLLAALAAVLVLSALGLAWLWFDASAAAQRHDRVALSLGRQLAAERSAQAAANCTLAPLDLDPGAQELLSSASSGASSSSKSKRSSGAGPAKGEGAAATAPMTSRNCGGGLQHLWPGQGDDPSGEPQNDREEGEEGGRRQQRGPLGGFSGGGSQVFGGGGDVLEEHLRTLTDLYQNQILLRMQKALENSGIGAWTEGRGAADASSEGEL